MAKVPTAARQEESVVAAGAPLGAHEIDRFTHGNDDRDERAPAAAGRGDALVTNEGFEHVLHLRRQTRAHLYRPCVEHPPRSSRSSAASVSGDARGRRASSSRSTWTTLAEVDAEAIACRSSSRSGTRSRSGVSPTSYAGATRRRTSSLARGRAGVPRVRARLDDGGRRVPRAGAPAYLGRSADACADAGLPPPARHALVGRARDARRGRRARGVRAPLGPGSGRRRRRDDRVARRLRERLSFDMGGTSTDVCAIVGGVARRERAPRRTAARASSDARRAHRRRGRRLRRLARRGRRAAVGAGERRRRSGTGVLRRGRDAGDGDGREPAARTPALGAAGRDRARRRGGAAALAGIDPAGVVDVVDAEMVRALRVVSVEQGARSA